MSELSFERLEQELLSNPDVKKAFDDLQPEFAIKSAIIEARVRRGVTQKHLAAAMETSQSAVSRWETGPFDPRLSSLRKLAGALDITFEVSADGVSVVAPEPAPALATEVQLPSRSVFTGVVRAFSRVFTSGNDTVIEATPVQRYPMNTGGIIRSASYSAGGVGR